MNEINKKITLNKARWLVYPWLGLFAISVGLFLFVHKMFSIAIIMFLILIWRGLEKSGYGTYINRDEKEVKNERD